MSSRAGRGWSHTHGTNAHTKKGSRSQHTTKQHVREEMVQVDWTSTVRARSDEESDVHHQHEKRTTAAAKCQRLPSNINRRLGNKPNELLKYHSIINSHGTRMYQCLTSILQGKTCSCSRTMSTRTQGYFLSETTRPDTAYHHLRKTAQRDSELPQPGARICLTLTLTLTQPIPTANNPA